MEKGSVIEEEIINTQPFPEDALNEFRKSLIISDLILVPGLESLYSIGEILKIARRNQRKLAEIGFHAEGLEISAGSHDFCKLLNSGIPEDSDYLRWRFYRASDIASALDLRKIILPFAWERLSCMLKLFQLFEEILDYDSLIIIVLSLKNSFSLEQLADPDLESFNRLKATGRFLVAV